MFLLKKNPQFPALICWNCYLVLKYTGWWLLSEKFFASKAHTRIWTLSITSYFARQWTDLTVSSKMGSSSIRDKKAFVWTKSAERTLQSANLKSCLCLIEASWSAFSQFLGWTNDNAKSEMSVMAWSTTFAELAIAKINHNLQLACSCQSSSPQEHKRPNRGHLIT